MINEIRSFLINEDLSGHPFAEPAPPAFAGVPLDSAEAVVRRHLCNPQFKPRTRNIIATAIFKLAMEHPAFQKTGMDKKIALVSSPPPMEAGISVTGFAADSLVFLGALSPKEDIGVYDGSWNISRGDSTHVHLFDPWSGSTAIELVTFANGVSSIVPLFDSGISFRFLNQSSVPTFNAAIEAFTPVSIDIARMIEVAKSDGGVHQIFKLGESSIGAELKNDFYSSTSPAKAAGALAIAYALHIRNKIGS